MLRWAAGTARVEAIARTTYDALYDCIKLSCPGVRALHDFEGPIPAHQHHISTVVLTDAGTFCFVLAVK